MTADELRAVFAAMTERPWRGDDDTPCVYSGDIEVAVLGDEAQNYDGDATAIIALANHADPLAALVGACERWVATCTDIDLMDESRIGELQSACRAVREALERVHEVGK
jgi:hypothetical protein